MATKRREHKPTEALVEEVVDAISDILHALAELKTRDPVAADAVEHSTCAYLVNHYAPSHPGSLIVDQYRSRLRQAAASAANQGETGR